jgi:hypothetical protein
MTVPRHGGRVMSNDQFDNDDLELLLAMCEPEVPSSSLRASLLSSIAGPWYAPFVRRAAELLAVSQQAMTELFAAIDDVERWMPGHVPGLELFHIEAGAGLEAAITGFVRLAPGAAFPAHRHVGHEDVLVLAGSFVHDGVEVAAGMEAPMAADTLHAVVAGAQGCLYLGVTRDGLAFEGEAPIGPDDPRA